VSGEAPATRDTETVEALRRVKAVEAEWDAKLRAAREATVKAVASEIEGERARRLEAARAASEAEAETIRREGAKEAEALRSGKDRRSSDRDDAIVAAVLGPFVGD
jgi:uncharacterized membrane protein YqiK